MKKLVLSIVLAIIATSACAKDWSAIRFGVDARYPPFESKSADFQFVGKDLDDRTMLGDGAGIGMRKEDADLTAKIDKTIADIINYGSDRTLEKKYFDFDVYGG